MDIWLFTFTYLCVQSESDHISDIPTPVGVRAEVTVDNASIRVSWQWSRLGVLTCVDLVTVRYQPDRGSLMRYTVDNTTSVTSSNLSNLQCNTEYAIWVYARGGPTSKTSIPRMVSLPARGMCMLYHTVD